MEAKLIINSVDFSPWVAENGIKYGEVYRNSRSVVTLDGTLYQTQVTKHSLDVALVELRDGTMAALKAAMTSPASVQFTTPAGESLTRTCYLTGQTEGAKTVRGGNTYYSGVSFTVEEK